METAEYRIILLKLHIHGAKYLKYLSRYNISFEIWYQNTLNTLTSLFGAGSEELLVFKGIRFLPKGASNQDLEQCRQIYQSGLFESVKLLKNCIKTISPVESPINIVTDVSDCIKYTALSDKEMEAIKNELTEAIEFLNNRNKFEQPWKWEIEINKIVKILNQIISLNSLAKRSI